MNKNLHLFYLLLILLFVSCSTDEQKEDSLFPLTDSVTEEDPQPKTIRAVNFVQICDTQLGFGRYGYEQDLKNFRTAVNQINDLNPDFVVICGDLVNIPNEKTFSDFSAIVKTFKMPCHLASGNHDVGNTPTARSLQEYNTFLGRDYYSFVVKNHAFIVTNTQLWKKDVQHESEKHDLWFKEQLTKHKNKPITVVGHYPLYIEDPFEDETYYNLPTSKRKQLLRLFDEHKVKAYLSGHAHKKIINSFAGTSLVTGETLSANFDRRPLGFRLWRVKNDSVRNTFFQLNN